MVRAHRVACESAGDFPGEAAPQAKPRMAHLGRGQRNAHAEVANAIRQFAGDSAGSVRYGVAAGGALGKGANRQAAKSEDLAACLFEVGCGDVQPFQIVIRGGRIFRR